MEDWGEVLRGGGLGGGTEEWRIGGESTEGWRIGGESTEGWRIGGRY